jgi:hypothetical protein
MVHEKAFPAHGGMVEIVPAQLGGIRECSAVQFCRFQG